MFIDYKIIFFSKFFHLSKFLKVACIFIGKTIFRCI